MTPWGSAVRKSAYCAAMVIVLLHMETTHADDARVIMQTKDKSITVLQAASWPSCDEQVRFAVAAKQKSVFEGSKVQLQKIIGGLRAITSGTCSRMTAIEIVGFYKSEPVYKGVVRKSEGWRLIPVRRTKQDSTDAAYDNQRFLDLLSQSSGPSSNQGQQTAAIPDVPPIVTSDEPGTGEMWRDQHAYRKLTQNLDQVLGLPFDVVVERCQTMESDSLKQIPPESSDLLYRICRAVAYAKGNAGLAKDVSGRIAESP